jgi:hypothetical protein
MKTPTADLSTTIYGTIIHIHAQTPRGRRWMHAHVPDSRNHASRAVDCEHRCGIDILEGALAAGLTLQDASSGRIARGHDHE